MATIEDMTDAIDELESGSYRLIRSAPSPFVGGRAVPAVLATAWEPGGIYAVGDKVVNPAVEGQAYRCVQAGKAAPAGGPSGTGTNIVDNTVRWDWIGPGKWALTVSGSLQPMRGSQLDRLAELYRTREVQVFYTGTQLRAESARGEPDRLCGSDDVFRFDSGPGFDSGVVDGEEWVVQELGRWSRLGAFHKAVLARTGR